MTDLYAIVTNGYAMRPFPTDIVSIATLVVVALAPFAPVVLLAIPFDTVLAFLAGLLR
jgi:hypothetical protein